MPSEPAPDISQLPCPTPGCTKFIRVRGFCIACYYRHLRHGTIQKGSPSRRWKHRLSEINEEGKTAICTECGPVTILRRGKPKSPNQPVQWRCSVDANHRSKLYKQAYRQTKKDVLLDHCEICGSPDKLCWDHDHKTGLFRGTLCKDCNTGIGLLKDDPVLMVAASTYIIRNKQKT